MEEEWNAQTKQEPVFAHKLYKQLHLLRYYTSLLLEDRNTAPKLSSPPKFHAKENNDFKTPRHFKPNYSTLKQQFYATGQHASNRYANRGTPKTYPHYMEKRSFFSPRKIPLHRTPLDTEKAKEIEANDEDIEKIREDSSSRKPFYSNEKIHPFQQSRSLNGIETNNNDVQKIRKESSYKRLLYKNEKICPSQQSRSFNGMETNKDVEKVRNECSSKSNLFNNEKTYHFQQPRSSNAGMTSSTCPSTEPFRKGTRFIEKNSPSSSRKNYCHSSPSSSSEIVPHPFYKQPPRLNRSNGYDNRFDGNRQRAPNRNVHFRTQKSFSRSYSNELSPGLNVEAKPFYPRPTSSH